MLLESLFKVVCLLSNFKHLLLKMSKFYIGKRKHTFTVCALLFNCKAPEVKDKSNIQSWGYESVQCRVQRGPAQPCAELSKEQIKA